jgi:hypothetical protein
MVVTNAFGKQDDDKYGWPEADETNPSSGNRGLYGVDLRYRFQIKNTDTEDSHACYVRLIPRNNGAVTFGAAKIVAPSGYDSHKVQPIVYTQQKTAEFTPGGSSQPQPIILPPNTTTPVDVIILFAHAGGSTLPANILLERPQPVPP